ncbi:uncharacterized protein C8orf48 homolog isoform X2 [Pogoniulus pusillus]|uniref:uncharacterized protein C8orf48 homolog isoform X2 n=1 Tax=Pogoniulus pusillus TaxID=488313 RepID=UPI0030B95E5B
MTAASADSSGSDEKRHMVLSQTYCSSGLDYSEDTFESFSEEEEGCWQEESKQSESCSTEDLEGSAVSNTLKGQNHAEMAELSDGELDALRAFCTLKISKMCQQLISAQVKDGETRKLQHGFTAKKTQTSGINFIVPDQLMSRIHLENIRETVKQVTEAEIHQSSVCPDCQKKEAELAEIAFLRRKKVLMENALIKDKLEEQTYSRNLITLLGEALRNLPKPSEDPRNLWQRLKCRKIYQIPVGNSKESKPLAAGTVWYCSRKAAFDGRCLCCSTALYHSLMWTESCLTAVTMHMRMALALNPQDRVLEGFHRVSLEPALHQAEQPQLKIIQFSH